MPKSNWANRLDTPPFEAYGVTCGITFTFGGLAVDAESRVLSEDGAHPFRVCSPPANWSAGLYYFNYPGGYWAYRGGGLRTNRGSQCRPMSGAA